MNLEEIGEEEPALRWLRWVVAGLLALGLAACLAEGGSAPPDPRLVDETAPSRVDGFDEIAVEVHDVRPGDAEGERDPVELCVLLADSPDQRRQGLMGRTDLAGYDGMLFRFEGDVANEFHMKDTPLPLSIAWFDAGGTFVSSADMEPCLGQDRCPTYGATRPYRYALEVPRGDLARIGIGPQSRLEVGGACS